MRYSLLAAALAAPVVIAAPTKRQSNIDTTVLQFALTLEHLENVFYRDALAKFSKDDFMKAGYGANYYENLQYIASDEASHVQFLSAALTAAGQTPTSQCVYSFPYTDVQSFITLSSIIEGVGTSAYLGGAPLITNKDYLTAAGSILVAEALHTSYQRAAVNEIPFASPYGTPLDPTSVFTLATAFIKSCPPTNPTLPFTPYPALALTTTGQGTCEHGDCSPKIFQRGWDNWSGPPTAVEEKKDVKSDSCSGKPDDKPYGDKPAGGKPEDKPYGDKPAGGKPEDKPYGDKPAGDKPADKGYGDNKPKDVDNGYSGKPEDKGYGDKGGYGDNKPAPAKSSKNIPALSAGQSATFTAVKAIPAGSYLTFVSGLSVVSIPATVSGMTASGSIPAAAMGQTYVFVTKSAVANGKLDAAQVLYGPAILEVKPAPPTY